MTVPLFDAIDGAHLIITSQELHTVGVWHGGHTVNFYAVAPGDGDAKPTTTRSIGDFETGDVSRSEARDAILDEFNEERARLGLVE